METYILVTWPDSQELIERDWFEEEAILAPEEKFGSAAFFIPEEKVITKVEFEDEVRLIICKECKQHWCTCGQAYREHSISEILELIVPMMAFKTSEEVKKIIRMIEVRTILNAPFHNQDSGD